MCKSECVCCRPETVSTSRTVFANQGPEILLNDGEQVGTFCSNAIITARYNWINFIPKNLLEQFHNMANIFFAVILIPYGFAIAATSAWSNLGPLIALLAIIMIKDGVEDIFRHRRDRRLNHKPFKKLIVDSTGTTLQWVISRAMDLRVGDVICCERDDAFPCDLVALASSNASTEINVTTANLDGESNLKKFYAVSDTHSAYIKVAPNQFHKHASQFTDMYREMLETLYVRVDCEQPTADLTKFEGRLSTKRVCDIPLNVSNMVLRGSKLQNTDFMVGLVIYTGKDTKLSLNGKQFKRKFSTSAARSNFLIFSLIIVMIVFSLIFAVIFTFWTRKTMDGTWYLPKASSPDEKALVEGAAQHGVVFVGVEPVEDSISTKRYKIEYRPDGSTNDNAVEQKSYLVDAVLEFTSERKRMTVMVRYPDGTFHIHSKGAESTMLTPENCPATSGDLRTQAIKYVTDFAVEGYRTLVFSSRQLEEAEYRLLLTDLHKASGLVGSERASAMQNAYAAIEANLSPKFVTAVEDQLQPGVKECLNNLREAGIQVWILTGDKEETAITVSQAAGHFTQQMSLLRLTHCPDFETAACMVFEQLEGLQSRTDERRQSRGKAVTSHTEKFYPQITATAEEVDDALYAVAEEVLSSGGENASKINRIRNLQRKMLSLTRTKITSRIHRRKHRRRPGCGGEPIGLVIDGKTLGFMLQPSLREAFLDLCMNVTTVLCCRMTPLQKASIVQLVQFGLSANSIGGGGPPVTAAVGDGGNDVAMILQASVGVGIYGKEGLEAARAADYSIPQFRHLTRLFLLHGHWSYHRISFTMNLFYFKCTALVTTQIMLNFYGGFSQTVSYSSLMFALFNLTMTSITCLLYGIFEQHLPENALLARPYLYRLISQQANLKLWYVMIWIVEGVWHGVITFIMTFYALGGGLYAPASFYDSGLSSRATYDLYFLGITNFILLWISVSVRILTLSRCINTGVLIGYGITLLNFVFFYPDQPAAFVGLFLSPAFWFTLLLTVVLANIPGLIWRILSDAWWTVQIELSKISSKRMRQKLLRSFRVWLSAIIWGDRDLTTSDIKEDE
ncbi:hypothetical protein CRM22_000806 [Opisthorchis felineus]|uniref:Uncharacterized protein n=1 Tax=Opisthorchis felineus TaxID=147828 RepID=A0A4S2MDR2_OPIFE|nr:hypothetical protein CRM22_000806 [Opisthorchis felineus]